MPPSFPADRATGTRTSFAGRRRRPLSKAAGTQLAHVAGLTNRGHYMRNAVDGADQLREQLAHSLRELGHERAEVRARLQSSASAAPSSSRWAELEYRACIAELVGRKATPAARKTVEGALAAVRAFREALVVH